MRYMFIIVLLVLINSCTTNPITTGPSEIPNMAKPNIVVDVPSCVSYNTEIVSAKKNSTLSYIDYYKPIPTYVYIANSAMNFVQQYIDTLYSYSIPLNTTFFANESKIVTTGVDSLEGINIKVKVYSKKDNYPTLLLNYYTDYNNHFKGFFIYNNRIKNEHIVVTFNNFFKSGKIIKVTYVSDDTLNLNNSDPQKITIKLLQRDSLLSLSGASYLPNWRDTSAFLTIQPKNYSFKAHINVNQNVAAMKVALVPKGLQEYNFDDYRLDKLFLDGYKRALKIELEKNDTLARIVKWSIDHNEQIPENSDIRWLAIVNYNLDTQKELTTDDLMKFFVINRDKLKDSKDFKPLYDVLETTQPILFYKQGAIKGNILDSLPQLKTLNCDTIDNINTKQLEDFKGYNF